MIVEIAAGLATTLVFALACEYGSRANDINTPRFPLALPETLVVGFVSAATPWAVAAIIVWLLL